MKYSIRGNLNMTDGTTVVNTINSYALWRLVTNQIIDESGNPVFTFEAWVNTSTDKDSLWADLKPSVDTNTGNIDWHECTHDEPSPQPCVIQETYSK